MVNDNKVVVVLVIEVVCTYALEWVLEWAVLQFVMGHPIAVMKIGSGFLNVICDAGPEDLLLLPLSSWLCMVPWWEECKAAGHMGLSEVWIHVTMWRL